MNPEKASFVSLPEKGEDFHKIESFPEKQYFVSMLLRGSINAAQIIKKGDKYFSHQQKMESIEDKEDALVNVEADSFILEYGFLDRDHDFFDFGYHKNIDSNIHSNIAISKNNSKHYLFDFGQTFHPYKEKSFDTVSEKGKKEFGNFIDSIFPPKKDHLSVWMKNDNLSESDKNFNKKMLSLLQLKSEALIRNSFSDYKLFEIILNKSQIDLFDKDFESYFEIFKESDLTGVKERGEVLFNDIKMKLEIISDRAQNFLSKM